MKNAYVGGAITIPNTRPGEGVLDTMIRVTEKAGYSVYCAEIDTNQGELDHPEVTVEEIFHKDYYAVTQSNLLVLECSSPSTGNGMEIMLAYEKKIPTIACVWSGAEISRMLLGAPHIKVIEYTSVEDLQSQLESELSTNEAVSEYVRPNWDDYFMAICRIVATRSTCDRLRSGAVLVKEKRIISTGYNGSPPGLAHCDGEEGHLMEEGHCVRTIHGEHNVILQAAVVPGASTIGSTLYTKFSPCVHCAKYIVAAGVQRVVMGSVYRNSDVIKYLENAGIKVDIYKENPKWNRMVQEMFGANIEKTIADEGDVRFEF
ncbi:MAG: cytidine/deoxycytidylate deaminase family protein [Candidatus Uhrbacteria bacterium]